MNVHAPDGFARLTEREKQTLRLIVRGHDAKSIARELDLSVHTINERLRDARRKLDVPSSRAAARLLLEREAPDPDSRRPDSLVPDEIGGAGVPGDRQETDRRQRMSRPARIALGVLIMSIVIALAALAVQPPTAPPVAATTAPADTPVARAAREFVELLDQNRWDDAYARTGAAFRKLNSVKLWTDVSNKVRAPLGAATSRVLLSQQSFPAPPDGYDVVKFRTSFATRADAVETVTLERAGGDWRVVAVLME